MRDEDFQLCAIHDCGGTVLTRGLCSKHYHKNRRAGLYPPRMGPKFPMTCRVNFSAEAYELMMEVTKATGQRINDIVRAAVDKYFDIEVDKK